MKLPNHLAIIMDGNGRWAKARGHSRFFGHIRGARRAKQVIEECARLGLSNLTLFTFSTENWARPHTEVSFLMSLLKRRLKRETANLIKNNIRFRCIGDVSKLPREVQDQVNETARLTAENTGMNLTFALNYGGRQEILEAAQKIAKACELGELEADEIDADLFTQKLQSSYLPDPDLIIRTSGEFRLSNFFLWQAAYSELYITDVFWPDFSQAELHNAFEKYQNVERRFGKTGEQVSTHVNFGNDLVSTP